MNSAKRNKGRRTRGQQSHAVKPGAAKQATAGRSPVRAGDHSWANAAIVGMITALCSAWILAKSPNVPWAVLLGLIELTCLFVAWRILLGRVRALVCGALA